MTYSQSFLKISKLTWQPCSTVSVNTGCKNLVYETKNDNRLHRCPWNFFHESFFIKQSGYEKQHERHRVQL